MRTQRRQTAHNRAVGRIAAYYGRKGYTVWADLPAYREKGMKPSEVFGKVPDIIAQRPLGLITRTSWKRSSSRSRRAIPRTAPTRLHKRGRSRGPSGSGPGPSSDSTSCDRLDRRPSFSLHNGDYSIGGRCRRWKKEREKPRRERRNRAPNHPWVYRGFLGGRWPRR